MIINKILIFFLSIVIGFSIKNCYAETLTLDINAKNYTSSEEIVDHIASELGIKWTPLFYAPGYVAKSSSAFVDRMSDLGWLSPEIDNIVINITLPKKKCKKKIKNLDNLMEMFNDIMIRTQQKNKGRVEVNWINLN
jgi:hypothetical protein